MFIYKSPPKCHRGDNYSISSNWKPLLLEKTRKGITAHILINTDTRHLSWSIPRSIRSSLFQGYLPMPSGAVVGQIERLFSMCQFQHFGPTVAVIPIPMHGWLLLYISVVLYHFKCRFYVLRVSFIHCHVDNYVAMVLKKEGKKKLFIWKK